MSRIGKKPIQFADNTTVAISNGIISVKGPKGELKQDFKNKIDIKIKDKEISVDKIDGSKEQDVMQGTVRALIINMIIGVNEGYKKSLELNGVGYRVAKKGNDLEFNIGFSHPVTFQMPQGIECSVEKNVIYISGIDKQLVGEVSANIRKLKKPEPYKGKGIKYTDEHIRRKAGKAGKAAK